MISLEIFPNLTIYKIQSTDSKINVPIEISNVTALIVNPNGSTSSSFVELINNEPFSIGDSVVVDDIPGNIISVNTMYIDIIHNSEIRRMFHPKNITSVRSYSKQYNVKKDIDSKVILTGIINNLSWQPTYILILSNYIDVIYKFIMTAQINNHGIYPFNVDNIIFNTKPVLTKQSIIPNTINTLFNENNNKINIDINTSYYWNNETKIYSEMSFPIFEVSNLEINRVYFLDISANSKPTFGYIFKLLQYIHPGPVRIHDKDFNLIGLSTLEVNGYLVTIKIGIEENLISQVIVNTHYDKSTNHTTTNFDIKIYSKFNHPILLISEIPFNNILLQSNPKVTNIYPNKLVWYFTVNHGYNHLKGTFSF